MVSPGGSVPGLRIRVPSGKSGIFVGHPESDFRIDSLNAAP
jgi:hypothetical protein